jgi:hypothetical protein
MARVELNVQAPDFIPPLNTSCSAIKNAVCEPHGMSRILISYRQNAPR